MSEPMRIAFLATDSLSEVLRKSTVLRRCREKGMVDAVAAVERVCAMFPACPTHGKLDDPILVHVGSTDLAVVCPWCSSREVLAAWEAEGRRGVA
jgi:hypothetical protein